MDREEFFKNVINSYRLTQIGRKVLKLNFTAIYLLMYYISHNPSCYKSKNTIADEMGTDEKCIRKNRDKLLELNFINRIVDGNTSYITVNYDQLAAIFKAFFDKQAKVKSLQPNTNKQNLIVEEVKDSIILPENTIKIEEGGVKNPPQGGSETLPQGGSETPCISIPYMNQNMKLLLSDKLRDCIDKYKPDKRWFSKKEEDYLKQIQERGASDDEIVLAVNYLKVNGKIGKEGNKEVMLPFKYLSYGNAIQTVLKAVKDEESKANRYIDVDEISDIFRNGSRRSDFDIKFNALNEYGKNFIVDFETLHSTLRALPNENALYKKIGYFAKKNNLELRGKLKYLVAI